MTELRRPGLRPESKKNLIGLDSIPLGAALISNMQQAEVKQLASGKTSQFPLATSRSRRNEQESPSKSLDVSAVTDQHPTPGDLHHGHNTGLNVPPSDATGMDMQGPQPSPGSMLARTPVGAKAPSSRNVQESRLSVASSVRGTSGLGYVSSPGDSMSQSAVSTTLFSSPGRNGQARGGADVMTMPLANDKALVAMRTVATAVAQGNVSVEGIVSNALAANISNFRKDGVMMLFKGLSQGLW